MNELIVPHKLYEKIRMICVERLIALWCIVAHGKEHREAI